MTSRSVDLWSKEPRSIDLWSMTSRLATVLAISLSALSLGSPTAHADSEASEPPAPEAAPDTEAGPAPLVPMEETEDPPTIIESDRLEMQAFEDRAHFVFTGNVTVSGNNLTVRCDLMEVFSLRDEAEGGAMPAIGRFQQIVATGNVSIEQEGRIATAGRADMFPIDGRIVLTENPEVRNEHGSVTGARIVLYQGESRAIVESEPGQRPRITLPTLPDLGVDARRPATRNDRQSDR